MPSSGYQHCAKCIGILSFPMVFRLCFQTGLLAGRKQRKVRLSIDSPLSSSITPSLFHSRLKTFLFCKFFQP